MKKTKTFNSNIGELSHDLLGEFDETDLQDKKVSVIVHEKDKIKVEQEFVLLFVENLHNLLVSENITLAELKVLLTIVKFSQFRNVFKITQKTISNHSGVDAPYVSRIMKKLKEKQFILRDEENEIDYVNPYLFLKGSIKEFKATEMWKQMSLHFTNENIKNPY